MSDVIQHCQFTSTFKVRPLRLEGVFSSLSVPRYRTANLLLAGIMPGPKEQDYDEIQRFMRILVNELLRLWQNGVRIPTPSCPEGRLVRVALVGVCCDKPAAHKIGGFGSHSHTYFCTRCWITQKDKARDEAFMKNGKSILYLLLI